MQPNGPGPARDADQHAALHRLRRAQLAEARRAPRAPTAHRSPATATGGPPRPQRLRPPQRPKDARTRRPAATAPEAAMRGHQV